jgi:hypothetical protein
VDVAIAFIGWLAKVVGAMPNKPQSGLNQWFKEKWVDLSRPKKGGGYEPCGRSDADSGKYPKCVPASRAARMTPAQIESAIRRKRMAESRETRQDKKPIMVETVKKESKAVPTDMKLYNKVKSEAKAKFDVYPSAYANGWLVQEYKRRGGKYKTLKKSDDVSKVGDKPGHPFRGNQHTKAVATQQAKEKTANVKMQAKIHSETNELNGYGTREQKQAYKKAFEKKISSFSRRAEASTRMDENDNPIWNKPRSMKEYYDAHQGGMRAARKAGYVKPAKPQPYAPETRRARFRVRL